MRGGEKTGCTDVSRTWSPLGNLKSEMYHTLKPSIINIHQHYYCWIFSFILEKVHFFSAYFSSKGLIWHFFNKKFIKDTSCFHLRNSYLLLHVKHLRDSTPNTIWLLSGIVGYNSKKVKSTGNLWYEKGTAEARKFQSACSSSTVTDQKTKGETAHPKPALP